MHCTILTVKMLEILLWMLIYLIQIVAGFVFIATSSICFYVFILHSLITTLSNILNLMQAYGYSDSPFFDLVLSFRKYVIYIFNQFRFARYLITNVTFEQLCILLLCACLFIVTTLLLYWW